MNNKVLLDDEIRREFEHLKTMEIGTESYKIAVENLTKLIDRANEMEKIEIDSKDKLVNRDIENGLRLQQIKEDRITRWIRLGVDVAGIFVPVVLTVWGTRATFEFEKEGTVTTIMGRGFINKLLPKK